MSVLSLAENKISDTSELVQAVKKLPNLEVLTVKGNPLVTESEYKNILLGNLENLKYLDYIYIDESSRKTGALTRKRNQVRDGRGHFQHSRESQLEGREKERQERVVRKATRLQNHRLRKVFV